MPRARKPVLRRSPGSRADRARLGPYAAVYPPLRSREDVEAAAAEGGMKLDVYLKHQPTFRPLFPEWKTPPAQQSA